MSRGRLQRPTRSPARPIRAAAIAALSRLSDTAYDFESSEDESDEDSGSEEDEDDRSLLSGSDAEEDVECGSDVEMAAEDEEPIDDDHSSNGTVDDGCGADESESAAEMKKPTLPSPEKAMRPIFGRMQNGVHPLAPTAMDDAQDGLKQAISNLESKDLHLEEANEELGEIIQTALSDGTFEAAVEAVISAMATPVADTKVSVPSPSTTANGSESSSPQEVLSETPAKSESSSPWSTTGDKTSPRAGNGELRTTVHRLRHLNAKVTDQLADALDDLAKATICEASLTRELAEERRAQASANSAIGGVDATGFGELDNLTRKNIDLSKLLDKATSEKLESDLKVQKLEKAVEELNEQLTRRHDEDPTLQQGSNGMDEEDARLTNSNEELSAQKQSYDKQIVSMRTHIDSLEAVKSRLSTDRANAVAEGTRLAQEVMELKVSQAVFNAAKQDENIQSDSAGLNEENANLKAQIDKLENALGVAEAKVASVKQEDEVANLTQENTALRCYRIRLEAEKMDAEARDSQTAQELVVLKARNARLEAMLRPTQSRPQSQPRHPQRPVAPRSAGAQAW